MYQLIKFIGSKWQEIIINGIWIPIVILAIQTGSFILILFSLIGGGALFITLQSLIEKYKNQAKPSFVGEASKVPRKGLIFTVGRQKETIEYAIKGQQPKFLGFICTNDTLRFADEIVKSGSLAQDSWCREIVNPRDIEDVRAKTHSLLDWMTRQGLQKEEIALDPTGGLTPMSLGAFSVAQERQVDSQYVRSNYDDKNMPIGGSQELIFICRYSKT